ncbi:MAG: hypothetical protein K2G74_09190 [Muribaculaceae bacterium]|nr:hypothetical protein [Muribaculaceae bacterium]
MLRTTPSFIFLLFLTALSALTPQSQSVNYTSSALPTPVDAPGSIPTTMGNRTHKSYIATPSPAYNWFVEDKQLMVTQSWHEVPWL